MRSVLPGGRQACIILSDMTTGIHRLLTIEQAHPTTPPLFLCPIPSILSPTTSAPSRVWAPAPRACHSAHEGDVCALAPPPLRAASRWCCHRSTRLKACTCPRRGVMCARRPVSGEGTRVQGARKRRMRRPKLGRANSSCKITQQHRAMTMACRIYLFWALRSVPTAILAVLPREVLGIGPESRLQR